MTNRAPLLLIAVSISVLPATLVSADDQGPAARPPMPPAAGASATDPFPNACVDCHVNYVERKMDVRLSTLMAGLREKVEPRLLAKARAAAPGVELQGKHPDARGALSSIPDGCIRCHGQGASRAPAFAQLIHAVHMTGGAENHFIAKFEGKCTHCHKLDGTSGALRVPSAPEK